MVVLHSSHLISYLAGIWASWVADFMCRNLHTQGGIVKSSTQIDVAELRRRAEESRRHPYLWYDTRPSPVEVLALLNVVQAALDLAAVHPLDAGSAERTLSEALEPFTRAQRVLAGRSPAVGGSQRDTT